MIEKTLKEGLETLGLSLPEERQEQQKRKAQQKAEPRAAVHSFVLFHGIILSF